MLTRGLFRLHGLSASAAQNALEPRRSLHSGRQTAHAVFHAPKETRTASRTRTSPQLATAAKPTVITAAPSYREAKEGLADARHEYLLALGDLEKQPPTPRHGGVEPLRITVSA
jgi:hypothetical protein